MALVRYTCLPRKQHSLSDPHVIQCLNCHDVIWSEHVGAQVVQRRNWVEEETGMSSDLQIYCTYTTDTLSQVAWEEISDVIWSINAIRCWSRHDVSAVTKGVRWRHLERCKNVLHVRGQLWRHVIRICRHTNDTMSQMAWENISDVILCRDVGTQVRQCPGTLVVLVADRFCFHLTSKGWRVRSPGATSKIFSLDDYRIPKNLQRNASDVGR